jgi:hypothetical protein
LVAREVARRVHCWEVLAADAARRETRAGSRTGPGWIYQGTLAAGMTTGQRQALKAAYSGWWIRPTWTRRVGRGIRRSGRSAARPVVIYSMATSSAGGAPRGLEFLHDRHRLNVATSRARAMAIIVASPDFTRVSPPWA